MVRWIPPGVKRPQMQWNRLDVCRPSAMLDRLGPEPWVYFVHSFAPEATADVVATCDYGGPVVAAVERDNVWATQFHPEKSGTAGLEVLRGFVDRCAA
jgi:glutamine amidotransferase